MTDSNIEERRKKRLKKRMRKKRLKIAFLVLLLIAVVAIFLIQIFDKVYDDQKSFEKFASKTFNSEFSIVPKADNKERIFKYSDSFSTAIEADETAPMAIETFANKKVSSVEKKAKKNLSKKGQYALLTKWHTYKSDRGVTSLLIYSVLYKKTDKDEMTPEKEYVSTYLFKTKNSGKIKKLQIMESDYKDKTSKLAKKYTRKGYKKKELDDNWQDFFNVSKDNLNKFIITDSHLIYFAKAGKDGELISSEIPLKKVKEGMRDTVLKRLVSKDDKIVAITFDDGPGGECENSILKSLDYYDDVATFFYVGTNVKGNEDKIKKAYSLGCEIGNHTWKHVNLADAKKSVIKSQIEKTNNALKEITGENPTLLRPPYGSFDKLVKKNCNMPIILWSVDSMDWDSKNANKIFNEITKTDDLDGRIILMHSIYDSTAEAVEKLLPWLDENEYETVTVSELIEYRNDTKPVNGKAYY